MFTGALKIAIHFQDDEKGKQTISLCCHPTKSVVSITVCCSWGTVFVVSYKNKTKE